MSTSPVPFSTLCVIHGNESRYIVRLIASFSAAFDELSLVRASGSLAPDDTERLAEEWCKANGKSFVASAYLNRPDAAKWEHVDDFGAARNQSFAQATGRWLFWADCDDLAGNSTKLRRVMENTPETVFMLRFPYDVHGTGKIPMRERCIRREAWDVGSRWQFPVHENIVAAASLQSRDESAPAWIHAPDEVQLSSRKRNMRILGRALKDAPMNFFYLHQEHYCAGNKGVAEALGDLVVQFPNLDPSFRTEVLLNIAKITQDRDKAGESALTAHGLMPWCREPLAALAMLAFEKNDTRRALFWAQQLVATSEPQGIARPWTHEPKWYGWAGDDLLARALRLNGQADAATAKQLLYHGGGVPRISLLHATRGRTGQALACRDSWLSSADNARQIEHIFAVDADDKESAQMSKQFVSVVSDKKSCVAAWNLAACKATGEVLVQLSDDWQPFTGWDTALLEAIGTNYGGEYVLAVHDGTRTDDLLCMAICSRARWEKQGRELFSAEYESVFSDNEFSARAFADGVVIDARQQITFKHLHPCFGLAANDATYQHTNAPERYARGLETFQRRNPAKPAKRMPRFTVAEITDKDEFGRALLKYSAGTKSGLEIGGGFGDGSTGCIISENLVSVENHPANVVRHGAALAARDGGLALHGTATNPSQWMTTADVRDFYANTATNLNHYPLDMVLSWLAEDRETASGQGVVDLHPHAPFDFVLIDGGPFSAESEWTTVLPMLSPRAFVALDDVNDIKNHRNYHAMKLLPRWELVWENLSLRNGAAIFRLT
jgi:glycosyltransferase involved in cell wall biosynthesis